MNVKIVHQDKYTLTLEYMLREVWGWHVSRALCIEEILSGQHIPDMLIFDIQQSEHLTLDFIRLIGKQYPALKQVIFTHQEDQHFVQSCLEEGVHGYLLKSGPFNVKQEMIREIVEGGLAISPKIMRKIISAYLNKNYILPIQTKLTKRENDVVNLLVDGYSYKGIAGALSLSIETVRHHIRHIYDKLQVGSKEELIRQVLAHRQLA